MTDFFLAIALVLLVNAAVGLARVRLGPTAADRLLPVNLLGTSTIAAVLLVGTAAEVEGTVDVALVAAGLAAFASVTFARRLWWRPRGREPGGC